MADKSDTLRLAEAVAARLCHDLGGPIGSLNQALELAAADVPAGNEAFALAREAAGDLVRRLRWRRAAWAPDCPALDVNGLRDLVANPLVDLAGVPPDTVFAPPMVRLLLNVLLMATESLPRRGRIAIAGSAGDVFIAIDGPNAAWPAGMACYLVDEDAAWDAVADPRTLQAPLTALLARGLGLRLSMLLGPHTAGPPVLRLSET